MGDGLSELLMVGMRVPLSSILLSNGVGVCGRKCVMGWMECLCMGYEWSYGGAELLEATPGAADVCGEAEEHRDAAVCMASEEGAGSTTQPETGERQGLGLCWKGKRGSNHLARPQI